MNVATRVGDERVQVPLSRDLAEQLEYLAIELRRYLDEKPDRAMQRGPMLSLVARWFYSLPRGVQGTILNAGRNLTDQDKVSGVPDFREAHDRYLASLSHPEWLVGVSEAIERKPASAPRGAVGASEGSLKDRLSPSPKTGFFVEKRAPRKQRDDVDVQGAGGDASKGDRGGAGKK